MDDQTRWLDPNRRLPLWNGAFRTTVYTPVSYLYPSHNPNYINIIVPSDVPFDFRWPHSIKPQVSLGLVYAAQGPALLPLANQSG